MLTLSLPFSSAPSSVGSSSTLSPANSKYCRTSPLNGEFSSGNTFRLCSATVRMSFSFIVSFESASLSFVGSDLTVGFSSLSGCFGVGRAGLGQTTGGDSLTGATIDSLTRLGAGSTESL